MDLGSPLVTCVGLFKTYNTHHAVNNLSLQINRGDIYGLVGANGSGKTTLIRMITELISPSLGQCRLSDSKDGGKLKIGAIVETPSLYLNLTGQKNIEIACDIANIDSKGKVKELMNLAGLSMKTRTVVKKYSLGMKQRLAIAMALVNEPDLLILDEPTNGLDPQGIKEIRELLVKLNREKGTTILVSSHILSELGRLATRFGFIEKGVLIKESTLSEIESECNPPFITVFSDNEKAALILKNHLELTQTEKHLELTQPVTISQIVKLLNGSGIEVLSGHSAPADLEAYFFNLLKGGKGNE